MATQNPGALAPHSANSQLVSPVDTASELRRRCLDVQAFADGWRVERISGAEVAVHELLDADGSATGVFRVHTFTAQACERLGGKSAWALKRAARLVKSAVPEQLKVRTSWYLPPNVKAAIAEAGGVVYLANGEKAVTAYRAGGILNAICTTKGEGTIPSGAVGFLLSIGALRVVYIHDKDDAGQRSAAKWRDALCGSGIDYAAYQWPDCVPPKGDANDALMAVGGVGDAFRDLLKDCPPAELPAPQPSTPRRAERLTVNGSYPSWEAANAALIDVVAARIRAHDPHARISRGWLNHRSLLRDEKRASTGLNMLSGAYKDFATGETLSLRAYAERLGIDTSPYTPQRSTAKRRPRTERVARPLQPAHLLRGLPTLTPDHSFNAPYVPVEALRTGDVALRSPLGTGKTTAIMAALKGVKRVLWIVHRAALTQDTVTRLNAAGLKFDHYEDFSYQPHAVRLTDRLVITLDSLDRLTDVDPFDVVVFDEVEQGLTHLGGAETLQKDAPRVWKALAHIIGSAQRFIAADGHLSDTGLRVLRRLRPMLRVIDNQFRAERAPLFLHTEGNAVEAAADRAIQAGEGCIVLVTDRRSDARRLEKAYRKRYGADAVRAYHGWNSGHRTAQQEIARLNEIVPTLRVLIASPTLSTGVDIQAPVKGVYATFRNPQLSVQDAVQMLLRYRRAEAYHVYTLPDGDDDGTLTDPAELFQQQQQRALYTAQLAEFDRWGLPAITDEQRSLGGLHALFTARLNVQRRARLSHLVALLEREGFRITPMDASAPDDYAERIKAQRAELHTSDLAIMLATEPVDNDALKELRLRRQATETHYLGNWRYQIEHTTGQKLTENLFERYSQISKRRALIRVTDFLSSFESSAESDRADYLLPMHQRRHRLAYRALLEAALEILGATITLDGGHMPELTGPEFDKRAALFVGRYRHNIIMFDGRHDLSENPRAVLRRVLGRYGIYLKRRCVRMDGRVTHVYGLDHEALAALLDDVKARLAAQAESVTEPDDKSISVTSVTQPKRASQASLQAGEQSVGHQPNSMSTTLNLFIPPT